MVYDSDGDMPGADVKPLPCVAIEQAFAECIPIVVAKMEHSQDDKRNSAVGGKPLTPSETRSVVKVCKEKTFDVGRMSGGSNGPPVEKLRQLEEAEPDFRNDMATPEVRMCLGTVDTAGEKEMPENARARAVLLKEGKAMIAKGTVQKGGG